MRSRRGCAPPTPRMSPVGHRFPGNEYFVTAWWCPNAAASRVGTNCCSLPCPPPAALEAHSTNVEFCFCNFEMARSKHKIRHPTPRRRWDGCLLFSLLGKTKQRRTARSYPSAPRQAFSAQPLPRRSLPATPRLAETNSGYDNANVRTRDW